MTDKEMLELAAKAAGYELAHTPRLHAKGAGLLMSDGMMFDSLNCKSDAFSLMVKLKIELRVLVTPRYGLLNVSAEITQPGVPLFGVVEEGPADQAEALTMRAITRCAAEVGRSLK